MTDYELYFPFMLAPNTTIAGTGSTFPVGLGSGTGSLAPSNGGYAVTIAGFTTPEEAVAAYPSVWVGVTQLYLKTDSAFSGSFSPSPQIVEPGGSAFPNGVVDTWTPCVYRTNAKPAFVSGGEATLTVTRNPDRFTAAIVSGITHARAKDLFSDEQLRAALELACASAWEMSDRAKLFTLTMVVELLSPNTPRPALAQAFVDRWLADLQTRLAASTVPAEDREALQGLSQSALFAKEDSINQRIKRHARTVFVALGVADVDEKVRAVSRAYGTRSALSHAGVVENSEIIAACNVMKDAANAMIEARMAV